MASILLVPIHLDALRVPASVSVASPLVDFRNLPWIVSDGSGGWREVNPQNPFLSETVWAEPMSLGGNTLQPGVHVHWALPTALATGRHPNGDRTRIEFDDVPDRWLVCRWRGGGRTAAWMVESDYLWDANEVVPPDLVEALTTWPWKIESSAGGAPAFRPERGTPPWRYLGRSREAGKEWPQKQKGMRLGECGQRLTAMGFGEMTFASFYPNCRSVFGLRDPDAGVLPGDWYEVFGWYSKLEHDPVKLLGGDSKKLQERYRWACDATQTAMGTPERLVCYGRVSAQEFTPPAARKLDGLTVAIGSSATEALAGLLASEMAAERRAGDAPGMERERNRLEDILDAVCLADRLPEREVDIGVEVEMARHDCSYRPIAGSPLFVVRARKPMTAAAQSNPPDPEGLSLPAEIATTVNALNAAQQEYDRAIRAIAADRDQLFSAWYRTLAHTANDDDQTLTATGLRGGVEANLDADDLVRYLRERAETLASNRMAAGLICSPEVKDNSIRVLVSQNGTPVLREILATGAVEPGQLVVWSCAAGETLPEWAGDTFAAKAVELRLRLRMAVEEHNRENPALPWEVAFVPGPRYWAPNEPVLLFSGPGADALERQQLGGTARHDAKGNLLCRRLLLDTGLPDTGLADAVLASPARSAIEEAAAALGLKDAREATPKPFLLEWKVSLAQAAAGSNFRTGVTHDYSPDYIRHNWSLGETNYDVRSTPLEHVNRRHALSAVGRSLLGDHAAAPVRARLESYIMNRLSQPVHRVTVKGPVTGECWFPKTAAYKDRRLDPAQADQMKEWARNMSRKRSGDEANISVKRMRTVLGGMGLPAGGRVEDAIVTVARELGREANIDARLADVGIDKSHWEKLKDLVANASNLAGLDTALGGDPECGVVFSRLLREAERKERFGKTGRKWFPLVHGLPDRGCIAAAMVSIAQTLEGARLVSDVKLSTAAAGAMVAARDEAPIESLLALASIPGAGPGAFGRLLAYADSNKLFHDLPATDSGEQYTDVLGHTRIDALVDAIDAWQHLNQRGVTLSQSLDGLHDALLMRRTGWQLPVADPMGFADYRAFHENVMREAIGANIQRAPAVLNPYAPLRNGELRLMELRMVDIFGQVQDIAVRKQVPARSVRLPGTDRMHLPPRLVQPARINLRWLAADSQEEEWNSHPASSPICGWLAADNLDSSILFYDQGGNLLGSLDREAKWDLAPGASAPVRPEDIENRWMRSVVVELAKKKPPENRAPGTQTPIEAFVDLIEAALESIDPHAIQSEEARALLFSRPIAVTRLSARFEFMKPPARRQGMYSLAAEARGHAPRTDGFDRVRMPLRIGEHQRLNDGVVGYWLTDKNWNISNPVVFHAPQTAWVKGCRDADASTVHWVSRGETRNAIVLMDPRGSVHATTGILPPKRIAIPPDQYLPALARIQVCLATAPVLTPAGEVQIPLRTEPGWEWQWIAREPKGIVRLPARPVIHRDAFLKSFPPSREPGGLFLWGRLTATNVLAPVDGDPMQAVVQLEAMDAAFKLAATDPNAIPEALQADVRRVLEIAGRRLAAPSGTADFTLRELVEGWLAMVPFAPSVKVVPPAAEDSGAQSKAQGA